MKNGSFTHSKVWCIVGAIKDQWPPGLEHISRKVHASDNDSSKGWWLMSHRVIGPREESRLDTVNST